MMACINDLTHRRNTPVGTRAVGAVLVIVLLAMSAVFARAADLPAGTKIVRDAVPETPDVQSWTVTSVYQEGENKLEVLLPDHMDPQRRYPVLYCLPVNAGTKGNWGHPLTEARKYDLQNKYQMIFVCPAYHILPWFGDNPARPEVRQNQYVLDVVIPFIEQTYPALAEPRGRYLTGFSKSALGAMSLFLRNPERFAKVAIFENFFGKPSAEQWEKWGFIDCYGTRANFDAYDTPVLLDKRAKELAAGKTRITVLCGGPTLRLGVDSLLMLLRDRKIPHVDIRDTTMSHDWTSGWLPLAVASFGQIPATTQPAADK